MSQSFNRRDFIKVAALGAAAAGAALTAPGRSQIVGGDGIATVCAGCRFGCALRLRALGRVVIDTAPNAGHPLAGCSTACSQLAQMVEEAVSRRPAYPRLRIGRRSGWSRIGPGAAIAQVAGIFSAYAPAEIAFVLGEFPDHIHDLVRRLSASLGGFTVLRLPRAGPPDGRITLADAARRLFGLPRLPIFDIASTRLVLAFGVTGDEAWIGPSDLQPAADREQIHFSPLPPAAVSAEWVRILPGSEAAAAAALSAALADRWGKAPDEGRRSRFEAGLARCGLAMEAIRSIAERVIQAGASVAVPGALALSRDGGAEAALAILGLNADLGASGQAGGLYLSVDHPAMPHEPDRTATLAEAGALAERIRSGQIKALFVHGVDPLESLPAALNIDAALSRLEVLVDVSGAGGPISERAHLVVPDRPPLESWGYQKTPPWADRPALSAIQPVIPPASGRLSTGDLLTAAARQIGGPAAALGFVNEVEFISQAVRRLDPSGGFERWLERGGWWPDRPLRFPAVWRTASSGFEPSADRQTDDAAGGLRLLWRRAGEASAADLPAVWIHPEAPAARGFSIPRRGCLVTEFGALEVTVLADARLDAQTAVLAVDNSPVWVERLGRLTGAAENAGGDWAAACTPVRLRW